MIQAGPCRLSPPAATASTCLRRWRGQAGAGAAPWRVQRAAPRPAVPALRPQPRRAGGVFCRAATDAVDVETARKLLDGQTCVLDVRSERDWDEGHITKPPRRAASVPFAAGQDGARFVAQVAAKFPSTAAKLIVMCADGGQDSQEAVGLLAAAGYSGVSRMEGGYAAYTAVWGPSGKRRPPAGRWVSTGKEALKSGLNIPGVAESYDEGGNLKTARYAKGLDPGQTL